MHVCVCVFQGILEPFSKVLSFTIQNCTLKLQQLIDICSLCNRAFSRVSCFLSKTVRVHVLCTSFQNEPKVPQASRPELLVLLNVEYYPAIYTYCTVTEPCYLQKTWQKYSCYSAAYVILYRNTVTSCCLHNTLQKFRYYSAIYTILHRNITLPFAWCCAEMQLLAYIHHIVQKYSYYLAMYILLYRIPLLLCYLHNTAQKCIYSCVFIYIDNSF